MSARALHAGVDAYTPASDMLKGVVSDLDKTHKAVVEKMSVELDGVLGTALNQAADKLTSTVDVSADKMTTLIDISADKMTTVIDGSADKMTTAIDVSTNK